MGQRNARIPHARRAVKARFGKRARFQPYSMKIAGFRASASRRRATIPTSITLRAAPRAAFLSFYQGFDPKPWVAA